MTAPSKVLIGPWNHSGPDCETPGPSLAREHLTVRWCDYWLKGIDNGIMDEPAVNVYVQTFDVPDAYQDPHDRLLAYGANRSPSPAVVRAASNSAASLRRTTRT